MIPANFDNSATPKINSLPGFNFSGKIAVGGREFIRHIRERAVEGRSFHRLLVVFGKTKTTAKVKPVCNMIQTFSAFRKYITQYH